MGAGEKDTQVFPVALGRFDSGVSAHLASESKIPQIALAGPPQLVRSGLVVDGGRMWTTTAGRDVHLSSIVDVAIEEIRGLPVVFVMLPLVGESGLPAAARERDRISSEYGCVAAGSVRFADVEVAQVGIAWRNVGSCDGKLAWLPRIAGDISSRSITKVLSECGGVDTALVRLPRRLEPSKREQEFARIQGAIDRVRPDLRLIKKTTSGASIVVFWSAED